MPEDSAQPSAHQTFRERFDEKWRGARMAVVLIGMVLGGCAQHAGQIFEPLQTPRYWPAPPEPPRIRYVGQLAISDDLKPAKSVFDAVGQAIFGRKDMHSMLSPYALCTDGGERLFVADSNGQMIHVFDMQTRQYQQWKPDDDDDGSNARFAQPVGIVYDPAGRLIVADSVAATLFVFDANGRFMYQMGQDVLRRPCGLALDVERQRLFVADVATHEVVVLSLDGQLLQRLGGRGTSLGRFNYPTNVAVDSQGRLYVSDSLNFRVQQFDADLKPLREIGSHGDMPGYFSQPKGLAVDSDDHLYVVDAHFEAVQIFDATGRLLLAFGSEGTGPGQFWLPAGLHVDAQDRIWVADTYNRRVQVFERIVEELP